MEQKFRLKSHPGRGERRLSHEQRSREVDWHGPTRRLPRRHRVPVAGEVSQVVHRGIQESLQGLQGLVSHDRGAWPVQDGLWAGPRRG